MKFGPGIWIHIVVRYASAVVEIYLMMCKVSTDVGGIK